MSELLNYLGSNFISSDGKRLSWRAYLSLIIVCLAFFTPGIVSIPPTDRDESSFAQASKQMIETGDYTDIRLQDAPRYKKPIGIYWLQTLSVRAFNYSHLNQIWAYRLPSLCGAILAVLMTAGLGALLFNPLTGVLASLMLASSVLLNVEARLAKTDAILLACIMVAMYGLTHAYLKKCQSWWLSFAFWTAIACGILIKGPIILLPICAVLVWIWFLDKDISWFYDLRPFYGILYALALIAPWFVLISIHSHGAFLAQSAGQDMASKLWQAQNRGLIPPGGHLLALPIAFFPFVLYAAFAAPDVWQNRNHKSVKFCLGWLVPTWIVFELSLTKLPHYVLPTYPAIAILSAKFLMEGFPVLFKSERRRLVILIVCLWFVIGMGFALAFALLPTFMDQQVQSWQILGGICLIMAQGSTLVLMPRHRQASVFCLLAGMFVFLATVFALTLPGVKPIWVSREIVQAIEPLKPCDQTVIVSAGYHEPSLVFLAGTNTVLSPTGAEAADELKKNFCSIAVVDAKNNASFLQAFQGAVHVPRKAGTIEGFNSGRGVWTSLSLFLLPRS